jgi:hypothetical protein
LINGITKLAMPFSFYSNRIANRTAKNGYAIITLPTRRLRGKSVAN